MSENDTQTVTSALEPVQVTFEVPGRLYQDYSRLVTAGVYMSTDEALRHAVITSWRYDRGTYHSLRIDLGKDDEEKAKRDDQAPAPSAEA